MKNETKRLLPINLQYFAEELETKADDQSSAETENTDLQTPPKDEGKTIPYDRFKQVNDDLRTFKDTFKSLGIDGVESLKSLVDDYNAKKQAEEERQRAEMSELERLQADLKAKEEAEQALAEQLAKLRATADQEKIRNDFIIKAQAAGVAYIDDAYQLADLSAVTVGEDGKVSGTDDVIKALTESKPFLLAPKKKQPEVIGESSNPASDEARSLQQQLEDAKKKKNFSLVVELSNKLKGLVAK